MRTLTTVLIQRISFASAMILALSLGCGCDSREEKSMPEKNILTITKQNFESEVLKSPQPVLVDFWATWCGPCKMIAPTVAELATEFEGKAKFGKVDVDAQGELAQKYNISAIPALMIFKDGKVVQQFVGVQDKSDLKSALDKFVTTAAPVAPTNSL